MGRKKPKRSVLERYAIETCKASEKYWGDNKECEVGIKGWDKVGILFFPIAILLKTRVKR